MPTQMPKPDDGVRKISIEVGSEKFSCDFGQDIPHAEAMKRLRIMLATFDREQPGRTNQ